jgi:hypothetical protein
MRRCARQAVYGAIRIDVGEFEVHPEMGLRTGYLVWTTIREWRGRQVQSAITEADKEVRTGVRYPQKGYVSALVPFSQLDRRVVLG